MVFDHTRVGVGQNETLIAIDIFFLKITEHPLIALVHWEIKL